MAKVKMTFSLDRETAGRLRQAAERLAKPQSTVVSEAIHDFSDRVGRLSERERLRLLRVFDEVVPLVPSRPVSQVKKEIEEIRRARHAGGRGGARDAAG
jgi:hypothetical protein